MGIPNIFVIILIFSLFLLIQKIVTLSQTIVVNVIETLNFSITNYTFYQQKNFFEVNLSIYNIGSKNFTTKLLLESECCRIISKEHSLNPSEELSLSLYYLALSNESINISIIVENLLIPLKEYEINFSEKLNEINKSISYIYENGKIKIVGDLDDYYFFILNGTTKQKRLEKKYNEIEIIDKNLTEVKIVFFNDKVFFVKNFELKSVNILSKIAFEIKKILSLVFSI